MQWAMEVTVNYILDFFTSVVDLQKVEVSEKKRNEQV